jgi:pyridoxal phosphate enzyme (YggS family)
MSIQQNLLKIKSTLPASVRLVAVSKTKPISALEEAYSAGQRIFGENKALEMAEKYRQLPKDIEWHFIGHLQSNKVKYIAPFVHLIHAVDSLKIVKEINKQALKNERIIDCLLQFHIAREETKFGFNFEEALALLESEDFQKLKNIRITGVMGMATNTDNRDQIHREFALLKHYFEKIKANYLTENYFKEISMGMSADYPIAIQEGSSLIRVGSSIFGLRK